MMSIEVLDFEEAENNCIWLVGDDVNIDTLWSLSSFAFVDDIQFIENYQLFDVGNLKCVFKKEYSAFLQKSDRLHWNAKLLLKIAALDQKLVHAQDLVINQKFSNKQLFRFVAKKYGMAFSSEEWEFVDKYAQDLQDLLAASLLSGAKVQVSNWESFFKRAEISWSAKMKNNTLLACAVMDSAIPAMQYMLRADSNPIRRAIVQFLAASIKDGQRIWERNEIWKDLVARFYN